MKGSDRRNHELKQIITTTQPNFCVYFDTESNVAPSQTNLIINPAHLADLNKAIAEVHKQMKMIVTGYVQFIADIPNSGGIHQQIIDFGKIGPSKAWPGEYRQSIPRHLKKSTGRPLDEMADNLGLSVRDLLDSIPNDTLKSKQTIRQEAQKYAVADLNYLALEDTLKSLELEKSNLLPEPDPGTLEHTPYLLCATFCRYDTKQSGKYRIYAENDGTTPQVPNFWAEVNLDEYQPLKTFWTDLDEFVKPGKSCTVYAHNVGYDINVVHAIDGLVKLGYRVVSVFDKGSYIMKLQKEITPRRKKTITFLGTGNYFSGSLKKIAETFGIPEKIDFNFATGTFLEAVPYCQRDVEICQTAMEGFRKLLTDYDLGPMRSTIAGQSFATFCYKFMPGAPIYIHDNLKATNLERKSYHGGRVECFKIGHFNGEDFYKLDVNAMYPSAMLAQKFPTRLKFYRVRSTIKQLKSFIAKGFGVIATVKIKESKTSPHIPYQGPKKLFFPGGTFTVSLATPEIIYCLKNDLILEVYELAVYKMEYIFKDYVDFFYTRRNEAKLKNDDMLANMFKLFLNALYGKFGQKSDNWELVGTCDPALYKIETECRTDGTCQNVRYIGGSVFEQQPETEAYNAFCAIASHVTSYARQMLAGYIETAGRENIYYCDTDSLFTNETAYTRLLFAGGIHTSELGKLKVESKHKEMILFGAKDYELDGKVTLKGIGRNDKKIINPVTNQIEYHCMQWPKQTGLLHKGRYLKYATITRIKHLSRRYNGGNVNNDGVVTPFILAELNL